MNEWRCNAIHPICYVARTRKILPCAPLFGPLIFLYNYILLLLLLLLLFLQLLFLLLNPFSVLVLLFFHAYVPIFASDSFILVPMKRLSKFLLGKAVSFLGNGVRPL